MMSELACSFVNNFVDSFHLFGGLLFPVCRPDPSRRLSVLHGFVLTETAYPPIVGVRR